MVVQFSTTERLHGCTSSFQPCEISQLQFQLLKKPLFFPFVFVKWTCTLPSLLSSSSNATPHCFPALSLTFPPVKHAHFLTNPMLLSLFQSQNDSGRHKRCGHPVVQARPPHRRSPGTRRRLQVSLSRPSLRLRSPHSFP